VEGWAVCSGCILVDVSRLNTITVDTDAAMSVAGAGISMLAYDNATVGTVGLISPSGICPSVGLAGFVQGGGIG
jgi:FAD/FMN-containing dehydrogenase